MPRHECLPGDAPFRPLFDAIDRLLSEQDWVWVAIDGRCASGKSTLGARLQALYDANLFHMDDYYVPFARKTAQRLGEPGGNVDYERFREEVLTPDRGMPILWRRFDCVRQTLEPVQRVEPAPLTVVEGSYSLHPALRDAYDLKVFLSIDPERQSQRILRRNGPEKHARFLELWIPLEEAYFEKLRVRESCDLTFDR